jgi:parvulin-like peptidyl-prolyl isomerase
MMSIIKHFLPLLPLLGLIAQPQLSFGFTTSGYHPAISRGHDVSLFMGLFDGIAKAFSNQDFKAQDLRVRASHILIKGDDTDQVVGTIRNLLGEIQVRAGEGDEPLPQVFAELARRESQCPSKDQGGDLGMFGKGKMVKEFDDALFPADTSLAPPAGNIIGPVITDFGAHIIYVTKRDENKDQVEEKLARIDPDAAL